MWANTLCPFSSSTRNMALGSGSVTVPSTSIASFFGKLRVILVFRARPTRPRTSQNRLRLEAGSQYTGQARTPSTSGGNISLTCGFERRSAAGRQHLVPVLGHGDRVLEMGGQGPILGHHGPTVGEQAGLPAARIDHRLDRHDQSGFQHRPAAGPAVVLDLRIL